MLKCRTVSGSWGGKIFSKKNLSFAEQRSKRVKSVKLVKLSKFKVPKLSKVK
jgi:hypothetical protein